LVEAMAIGTPVIALASSAMPSTLGDAGLLWPEDADPWVIAAAVARVHADPALREEMRTRGRRRYAEVFAPARLAETLARVLHEHGFA
jgi:glycosyltransferase involved in cell wall biosynthesis